MRSRRPPGPAAGRNTSRPAARRGKEAVSRSCRTGALRAGWIAMALPAVFGLFPGEGAALPRYAARYGQNCSLCHIDPTGGGARDLYASQYLVPTEFSFRSLDAEQRAKITPAIGENIVIGADLRTLARYSGDDAARAENNFFQMQSDIYLAFRVDDRFTAYFDRGRGDTYEVFGMAYLLPFNGYIKTGRFTPAYGWKFADHNAFVRERLGYLPPAHTDVGVEAGIFPGSAAVQFSLLNGNQGGIQDFNDELAVAVRVEYRGVFRGIGGAIGGSFRADDERAGVSFPRRTRRTGGPLGYLSWRNWTWVGEADWTRISPGGEEADTTGFVMSHEVACHVIRGLDLVGTYSFHDPDVGVQSGTRERLAAGFEFFYSPFAVISALVQHYRIDEGELVTGDDYTQTMVQFHFLY